MMISNYARAFAGRWSPRKEPALLVLPAPLPVEGEPAHATLRAACTLMRGEQVLVDGRWLAIDRAACQRHPMGGPSQTLLHLADGGILGSRFDFSFWSRDRDEQALAAKERAL